VDSDVLKEAQVQSYLPGGANVPSLWAHWRHLANTIEPSLCGGDAVLTSNYFDHLFFMANTVLALFAFFLWQ